MRKMARVERFRLVSAILPLALLLTGCSKKQTPAPPVAVVVTPIAPAPIPAASPASTQENPRFTAEIVANQEFQRIFAPKLMFRLEPYAGNDSGWSIRIALPFAPFAVWFYNWYVDTLEGMIDARLL